MARTIIKLIIPAILVFMVHPSVVSSNNIRATGTYFPGGFRQRMQNSDEFIVVSLEMLKNLAVPLREGRSKRSTDDAFALADLWVLPDDIDSEALLSSFDNQCFDQEYRKGLQMAHINLPPGLPGIVGPY